MSTVARNLDSSIIMPYEKKTKVRKFVQSGHSAKNQKLMVLQGSILSTFEDISQTRSTNWNRILVFIKSGLEEPPSLTLY
jgi:hypothetical protein